MTALVKLDGYKVGDLVRTLFDTGARGCDYCYGMIDKAGPKMLEVVWESGRRQRLQSNRVHAIEKCVPGSPSWDVATEELRKRGILAVPAEVVDHGPREAQLQARLPGVAPLSDLAALVVDYFTKLETFDALNMVAESREFAIAARELSEAESKLRDTVAP